MMIFNSQQHDNDAELAAERAKSAAAQQQPGQPTQSQPVIVTVPSSQPVTVPVPYPVPAPSQPAATDSAPSSNQIEIDVNSKLLNDQDLRSVPIDVKVSGGIATLTGRAPNEDLKTRAEKLAMTVKGVRGTVNNIIVQL
jgi:osmotically-inducible protein OsmY